MLWLRFLKTGYCSIPLCKKICRISLKFPCVKFLRILLQEIDWGRDLKSPLFQNIWQGRYLKSPLFQNIKFFLLQFHRILINISAEFQENAVNIFIEFCISAEIFPYFCRIVHFCRIQSIIMAEFCRNFPKDFLFALPRNYFMQNSVDIFALQNGMEIQGNK